MEETRAVRLILASKPTLEGAGVHLRRAFGAPEAGLFDPFLMLDDFRGDDPAQFQAGFPWHPHRGIETVTYMLDGRVEHGDSMGNQGVIGGGDVQWMTAGSGIVHQEMPAGDHEGRMGGFQLWANLPASDKMCDPHYQGIESDEIPETDAEGASVRVVCGDVGGAAGPVQGIAVDPEYLDVTARAGKEWVRPTKRGHTVFAYVIDGEPEFGDNGDAERVPERHVVLFEDGDRVVARAGAGTARFLLVSGRPLGEPIAWRGPIVMNTDEELQVAFDEYRNGTFIRHGAS